MDFDDALHATGSILSDRPADVLPIYLIGTAVAVATQTVAFVGVVLALLSLRGTGRLETLADALGSGGIDPTAEPGQLIDPTAAEPLAEAIVGLFTPTVIAIGATTLLVTLAVYLVSRALTGAAGIHTATAALRGSRGTTAGVLGASRDWGRFLRLSIVRGIVIWLPATVLLALGAVDVSPLLLALGVLVYLPYLLVIWLAFLFAPQAIVVEDVGIVAGIKRSLGFIRHNALTTVAYVVFLLGTAIGIGVVSVAFGFLGVNSATSLLLWFLVTPGLGLLKTGLYLDEPPVRRESSDGYTRAFRGAFARGLHALRAFVVGRFGYVAAMLGVFAVSIAGGWVATMPYAVDGGVTSEGLDPAAVFGTFPVDVFVNLAANNWGVSIAIAYGGLGFGVPAIANIAFNGVIVGALGGIYDDPFLFAAFIVPHGIVEIPALAVAGGFGLHLGRTSWGYVRGRRDAADLAGEIRATYYALLGLLPVFIVAALIEAFVTPQVVAYFF